MQPLLREYQTDLINQVRAAIAAGSKRILIQAATGSGKTRIAAAIASMALERGNHTHMLAPRRELVYQASGAFRDLDHSILMAGERSRLLAPAQVASIPTLHARFIRGNGRWLGQAKVCLIDEAHLSAADGVLNVLNTLYGKAIWIGLTATPARSDGKALGAVYDTLIKAPPVSELTDAGYLVPAKYFAPTSWVMDGVRVNGDDYNGGDLAKAVDRPKLVGDVVEQWGKYASDRQTVVNAASVAHSTHLCERFQAAGVKAVHIDHETETEERREVLDKFEAGEYQVITNVGILAYGWDCPAASCCVIARPTKSIVAYHQMVGRVLRPMAGKEHAIVIDHGGVVDDLGFVDDPIDWSLDGEGSVSKRTREARKRNEEKKACPGCGTPVTHRKCKQCGHEFKTWGRGGDEAEGDLAEVGKDKRRLNRKVDWDTKVEWLAMLRHHESARGYKTGWAENQYRERFGVWPNDPRFKSRVETQPSIEVAGWIKSKQIRYAKRLEKLRKAG